MADINLRRNIARNLRPRIDEDITEKNLENLARAMSVGADNVQIRSCFNSVMTPATFKSSNSQLSKLTNGSKSQLQSKYMQTKNWYKSDPFVNDYNQVSNGKYRYQAANQKDIFSVFSKQTQ